MLSSLALALAAAHPVRSLGKLLFRHLCTGRASRLTPLHGRAIVSSGAASGERCLERYLLVSGSFKIWRLALPALAKPLAVANIRGTVPLCLLFAAVFILSGKGLLILQRNRLTTVTPLITASGFTLAFLSHHVLCALSFLYLWVMIATNLLLPWTESCSITYSWSLFHWWRSMTSPKYTHAKYLGLKPYTVPGWAGPQMASSPQRQLGESTAFHRESSACSQVCVTTVTLQVLGSLFRKSNSHSSLHEK